MKQPEYIICKQLAMYIRYQYPAALFHFDYAGMSHTKAQAGMMKVIQGKRGWSDLFFAEARLGYHGLFIEVKAESPFKKDGGLKADAHLAEQHEMLCQLNDRGYAAYFGVGFESCKSIIDNYFK